MLTRLARPALVVIDMQNDFVRRQAPLEVADARATVPVIAALAGRFRAAGRPVVYTRYVADPAYLHLAERHAWIGLTAPPVSACVPDRLRTYPDSEGPREGVAVIDELAPAPADVVVDKVYYSAFHGTDLAARLAALAVDSLVVTGTITEMCVEDTARHAVHFGYPTVLVADAVSSNDPPRAAATLDAFARNYGWVMTADQVATTFGLEASA